LAALVSLWSVGCGGAPEGPERHPVTGTVKREGIAVDNGSIQFTPAGGGPAAMAMIKDGTYTFTEESGPVAGKQAVNIVHFPPRGEVPPGTPKKDADVLPETRFKKAMPQGGWNKEVEVGEGIRANRFQSGE
jgi:hypothetical protein